MTPLTLIFDLDDTLIASFPGYVKLHQQVATDLGWRVPPEDELVHYGPTWEATVARMWPKTDLAPFYARFDQILESVVYPPIEGAVATLQRLRELGHRQFIVTKRSSRRLAHRLKVAGIQTEWFDGIYPSDHGPAAKPDPRCFEPVWQSIAWHPERAAPGEPARAIYIGDRHEDQLVAERAGIPFVAVRSGPESQHGFPAPGAAHILDSVGQLVDLLKHPDAF